eukprot:maker-scaffold_1-snap-gene-31.40-mRNA-1 protein AED:0.00 eAED:0.00 QI:0/0/0/1/1/1/2/0/1178
MTNQLPLTVSAKGEWDLAAENEHRYFLIAEYARSGKAKCRMCGELIKNKSLRIGKPVKVRGIISSWSHPECFCIIASDSLLPQPNETTGQVYSIKADDIFGYKKLTMPDRKTVLRAARNRFIEDDDTEDSVLKELEELDQKRKQEMKEMNIIPQPKGMEATLMPFQRVGVSWMVEQEHSVFHGGVLADQMGLGKTLQTLGLLTHQKAAGVDQGPTLIVCPASAMLQWQQEILVHCSQDTLRVYCFHGSSADQKRLTPGDILRYDVILTTYPTVMSQYRKCAELIKKECQYCARRFLPAKLRAHNKYFCGPNAMRTYKLAKTEKAESKQKEATRKAMATLKIGVKKSSISTPGNIYKDLMLEANKVPVSMYTSGEKARKLQAKRTLRSQPVKKLPPPKKTVKRKSLLRGKRSKKPRLSAKRSTKKLDETSDSDSDYEESTTATETEETSEEEISRKKTARGKAKGEVGEVDQEVELKVLYQSTNFEPVRWSPKSKKYSELLNHVSPKTRKNRRSFARSKQKGKLVQSNNGETLEYQVESSEEETATDLEEPKKKASNPFRYAEQGKVVDDFGVDLGMSVLHCISWGRIVLDEAHKIKSRQNATAKAIFALRGPEAENKGSEKACFRWCLTGTPLQNRVAELHSLIRFLQVNPFGYYFCSCKGCECSSLNWQMGIENKRCFQCGHSPLRHFNYFNKHIMNPIQKYGMNKPGKRAMQTLRVELLHKIMLRRTKEEVAKDIDLPELSIETIKLDFSEEERDFYESIYKNTKAKFDTFVKKGTLLHNYAHIFELLSRLRRAADHPFLVIHGSSSTFQVDGEFRQQQIETYSSGKCDICYICNSDVERIEELAITYCRHTYHKSCIATVINDGTAQQVVPQCPACYQPLKVELNLHLSDAGDVFDPSDSNLCTICLDEAASVLTLPCGHMCMCKGCSKGWKKGCPLCRQKISKMLDDQQSKDASLKQLPAKMETIGELDRKQPKERQLLLGRKSILQKISTANFTSSTKMDAVVEEIKKMNKLKVEKGHPPHKAIIFSQYSDMIDMVQFRLRIEGIETVKLVGSLPVKERKAVLEAFRKDDNVRVLIMSLKAGGEGLNLQIASHVLILETWWNPQVHNQAYQRAHRIGQLRAVKAVLFVTNDTIEDRMHELQQTKELIFKGAVDGSATAIKQLSAEDMRFLFST